MKRQTQTILYHLLPVVFWLSAIGGSVLAYRQMSGYIVSIFALCAIHIIHRIPRWEEPVEQSFQVAVLLGIASYWLPSVLLLILPIWLYLMYRGLFGLRSVLATLIGLALVAIWAAVLYSLPFIFHLSSFTFYLPWAHFFAIENAWGWIPVGAFLVAYIASTIARQNLHVR